MAHSKFKHETIIHTERLVIRPIQAKDVEFIWEARSHRDIYKWTMAGQWLDRSRAEQWIKTTLETEDSCNFIIELSHPAAPNAAQDTATQTIIGSIGLFGTNELGYLFHPGFWNKGYATEAVTAFVAAVWDGLPHVSKVSGYVDSANAGSIKVLSRCGFREMKRGPYENVTLGNRVEVVFEIVRPEREGCVSGS